MTNLNLKMAREKLTDKQWKRIEMLLPGKAGDRGVTGADNRLFIEAVLWIARTGSPWRDLPQELGNWHTTYTRFHRWSKKGVWQKIMLEIGENAALVKLMIDSTVVRAHQHAAGSKKAGDQALGRSRGGLSTKVHVAVDAMGSPVRIFGVLDHLDRPIVNAPWCHGGLPPTR